jgi:hypothetical protein
MLQRGSGTRTRPDGGRRETPTSSIMRAANSRSRSAGYQVLFGGSPLILILVSTSIRCGRAIRKNNHNYPFGKNTRNRSLIESDIFFSGVVAEQP